MPNVFEHIISVSRDDVYFNGHVANDVFVKWMYEAAIKHSVSLGLTLEAYTKMNTMIVVKRNEVDYFFPAYENDKIIIKTWMESLRKTSAIRLFEIMREPDRKILAKAKSLYVCLNLKTHRPIAMTQDLIDAFI